MENELVDAPEPLDDMKLLGVRMAGCVNPAAVVQAGDVDDQRVSFPMPDAFAQVSRIELLRRRMFAPVHVNDTPHMGAAFEYKKNAVRELINLKRKRSRVHTRNAGRQAVAFGIVFRVVGIARHESILSPWQKGDVDLVFGLRAAGETAAATRHVSDAGRLPRTSRVAQIGVTIGQAGSGADILPLQGRRHLLAV